MYLETLIIINYRSCQLVAIDFSKDDANVFIGINDCGKSTILKAIETLLATKSIFNFVKDDKKKNDLSNTRATENDVINLLQLYKISLKYSDNKCYILGKFKIEENEIANGISDKLTPHLLWVLDNITEPNSHIWLGKEFDENTQIGKDILFTPDCIDNQQPMRLYAAKEADLKRIVSELSIPSSEIKNDNDKGKPKNMELARAIYNRKELEWHWIEYDRKDTTFFPQCRYLDWNISLEQLYQFANDAINTQIENQMQEAINFANQQARQAQNIIDNEFKTIINDLKDDLPNIIGFKTNLTFQLKSVLTDILINKANTDGDIHLEQQGKGVKRQIWFALLKWTALKSIESSISIKKIIWCFDEPETHLYPKSQREFFDMIKNVSKQSVQSFISTHSTVFIDRANLSSIYRVELEKKYTKYSTCSSVTDIYDTLQIKNSDFLFFDKFLVVEGDTEEYLIPHFFKVYTNKSLQDFGVQIINLGGKEKRTQNKQILEGLLKNFNKSKDNIIYLFDSDAITKNGLTEHERKNIVFYTVGKQDIEDSIPLKVWYELLETELESIPISLQELEQVYNAIPDAESQPQQAVASNQKFYPKVKNHLMNKSKDDELTKNLISEKIPSKGSASAKVLCKYITDIKHINKQIIYAFDHILNKIKMEKYNSEGESGVIAYEIGEDYILVQFISGKLYKYSKEKIGEESFTKMVECARANKGLNSYIKKNVNKMYDE